MSLELYGKCNESLIFALLYIANAPCQEPKENIWKEDAQLEADLKIGFGCSCSIDANAHEVWDCSEFGNKLCVTHSSS